MQETKYSESTSIKNDRINLREVLKVYIYHWKFFLFSIVIALIAAFLYLQFATYEYEVSSTILINDESNGFHAQQHGRTLGRRRLSETDSV